MKGCYEKIILAFGVVCLLSLGTSAVVTAQTSTIIDLGDLGGGFSNANGINNVGQVVGTSENTSHTCAFLAGDQQAFIWQNGVMSGLGTLGGPSVAYGVNNAGQVVGTSQTICPCCRPLAVLWQNGGMTTLGTLGGVESTALAINNAGQVVGFSRDLSGRSHAFLWQSGGMSDLGTLGGINSAASGINAAGQVVGTAATASQFRHAFLWQNGVMKDLGTLGGGESEASGINDAGQVVGTSETTSGERHVFLWQKEVMTDLGTLGGSFIRASGINAAGLVVGSALTASGDEHAFLWRNGAMTDLNTLLPADSGWELTEANAINDLGQVVGRGLINGRQHGYILNLCDAKGIDNPLPSPTLKEGNGWRMKAHVSEQDGLVLEDVTLGERYMARKISVPYLILETTLFPQTRLALWHNSSGPGASRLISFREIQPAGEFDPFVIEAIYAITGISPQGKSCLHVTQRYEFFKEIDEDDKQTPPERHCEPSQIVPGIPGLVTRPFVGRGLICARLNPIIQYAFLAREGESLISLNVPERLHFQVDGSPQATHLLIRDDESYGIPNFLHPYKVIEHNPLSHELIRTPIVSGATFLDTPDNMHQSHFKPPGVKIKEPKPPPGCWECVHMHWRWGTFLKFPRDVPPGQPIIPAGSTQTVEVAVVRARPEEEHPAGTLADLVNDESVVNTDNVFWYSPTGHQPADAFFVHGLFFSPLAGPPPDDTGPPDSGLQAVLFPENAVPGTTTFTNIDPATAGVLPPGFSVFQSTAVDISTSGSTGTGPILVAFLVNELDDPAVFSRLRLFHREGDTLVDRTILAPDIPAPDFEHRTLFARVDTLSPFVLAVAQETLPTNRPPVANAGPDQTVPCTTPAGTSVTLNGSGSTDPDSDSLTFTWLDAAGQELGNTAIVNLTLPLGIHTLTLVASDGKGGVSQDQVVVRVVDTTPPTIASLTASPDVLPVRKRELLDVSLTAAVADACDTTPTCRLVSVSSNEPVAGLGRRDKEPDWVITGPLTVKLRGERSGESSGRIYTLTVQCADAANNTTTKTLTVFVPPPGRMKGEGRVEADGLRFDFDFHVKETVKGKDGGKLELKVRAINPPEDSNVKNGKRDRGRTDRFETTRITEVVFTDDPDLMPGGRRTKADTVVFQGRGKWNGHEAYSFEASATDAGEPGKGRDSFAITIRDQNGTAVGSVSGLLSEGNNQAKRPKR